MNDAVHDTVEVLVEFCVPVSADGKSLCCQPRISHRIPCGVLGPGMVVAIQFHDDAGAEASEVYDVFAQHNLSPEPEPLAAQGAQLRPEPPLLLGHPFAQGFRERAQLLPLDGEAPRNAG